MAAASISVLTMTVIAVGAVTAARFVTHGGAQAGAAANTLGVSTFTAEDNTAVSVDVLGTANVTAGGVVAVGDALETDAQGRAITRTTGPVVGRAVTAASAAGDFIEVFLIPN